MGDMSDAGVPLIRYHGKLIDQKLAPWWWDDNHERVWETEQARTRVHPHRSSVSIICPHCETGDVAGYRELVATGAEGISERTCPICNRTFAVYFETWHRATTYPRNPLR